jgi:mRNA-degrading endonuclease RelE of RelBE toxin-antitoxin system
MCLFLGLNLQTSLLRVGNFRVFYDVDEAGQTVFIRAVREKPPHAETEDVL